MPQFETLRYEEQGSIAILTLDRPDRLNSLNGTLHRELYQAWEHVMQDDGLKVAVLTGTGRAFCSGADLRERGEARQRGEIIEREKRQNNLIPTRLELTGSFPDNNMWLEFDKPIVAAVNGLAVGAGTMLLGPVDVLIASERAYVADAHVTYAGWPGTGEALDITDKMPWGEVFRVGTEGISFRVQAPRAYQLGFYNEIVPDDQVLPRALEIARMIANQPPEAVKALRRIAQRSRELGLRDALVYGGFEARRAAELAEDVR
ncbi:MAG: enoyl-CoA hydratase/isomerase family protein [Dehalococcoidia bacterium]